MLLSDRQNKVEYQYLQLQTDPVTNQNMTLTDFISIKSTKDTTGISHFRF